MAIKKHLLILLCFCFPLFADKVITPPHQKDIPNPWFTGPLLAPSYSVVPLGSVNYEPYIESTVTTGGYDSHWKTQKASHPFCAYTLQPFIQIGLGYNLDIQIAPVLAYNYSHHQASWEFEDFPLIVDVQLFAPKVMNDWSPYVKLVLTETFPTGKYRNLNPKKRGSDSGGKGSFITQVGVVLGEMFRLSKRHFMDTRLLLQYTIPSAVKLKGFNSYGGGYGTRARLFPSQSFEVDFAVEILLAKRWAFACDFVGAWNKKTHFSGNPGTNADGTPAILGNKSGIQYSMAPALEYNWSANLGVIGGCWFTFAGKNSAKFWNAIFAINYYQ